MKPYPKSSTAPQTPAPIRGLSDHSPSEKTDTERSHPAWGSSAYASETVQSLLEPLYESENPSLIASHRTLYLGGKALSIPKFLFLGNRSGGVPLRIGLFAGLDAGRIETVAAVSNLLLQMMLSPAHARDYALFSYPVVNAAGFAPEFLSEERLRSRWASSPDDADAQWFRGEFRRIAYHGILTFRSTGESEGFAATVRSALLAEEVVKPAILAMKSLVPIAPNPVRVVPSGPTERAAEYAAGELVPCPHTRPWPLQVELFAPEVASADGRSQVLMLATLEILRRYRAFLAQGGDL